MSFYKFIPDNNISIKEINKRNFKEKYNVVLSLKNSYSNILNELTILKDKHKEYLIKKNLNLVNYNNFIKKIFFNLDNICSNTFIKNEVGENINPFEDYDSFTAINIEFNWISKNKKIQSNYACRLALFHIKEININSDDHLIKMSINTLNGYSESEITEAFIYFLDLNSNFNEKLNQNLFEIEKIIDRIEINIQSANFGLNKLLRISRQQDCEIETK